MAWGALVGGLVSGLATGAMSYASARQSQQETVDAYKHRHQWQTQDLRAAGLNPVLSATQGAGSVGSMAQAQAPDISQSANNFSAAQLRREEINTAKTTQAQQVAQAAQSTASAREAEARAEIQEQVAQQYRQNPDLAKTKALSDAGASHSTLWGSMNSLAHRGNEQSRDAWNWTKKVSRGAWNSAKDWWNSDQSSSAREIHDGGNIDRYLPKNAPSRKRGWRTNAK